MAKKKVVIKPRNPFTVLLANRGGNGAHGQTPKAKRSQAKAKMRKGDYD